MNIKAYSSGKCFYSIITNDENTIIAWGCRFGIVFSYKGYSYIEYIFSFTSKMQRTILYYERILNIRTRRVGL